MTRDPASGVPAELRGTYAGLIEKIPYLIDLGHHRDRTAAGLPVRSAGGAGRAHELLGLPADLVLRAARRLLEPAGPDRPARRVPRPGQGTPPGRAGGHPRRRLQPHVRRRRERPDGILPRPRQRRLLPARPAGPLDVHRFQRHRQHVQGQRPDRPPADPRQPPLLGRGDARRRLPLRPRGGPVTGRGRPAAVGSADHLGDRDRPGPGRHEADRRGVGRRRPLPGRQLRRATAGSSGTAGSATTSAGTCAASRAGSGT